MPDAPDQDQLIAGIRWALEQYLIESNIRSAVGESGLLNVKLTLDLQRGRVNQTKGAVWFERSIRIGGAQ